MASDVLSALPAELRKKTSTTLPDRVAGARDLWQRHLIETQHGSAVPATLPAAVIRPDSADEIGAIVEFARREGVPLVPFGAGSGVCGAISTGERTLVVDTKRLRAWEKNGDVLSVGPGALGLPLEEALEREGATLGHFPSSILCSTVGGWVAARGAGQCSGRYGKIEDMLLSADCVLGTGESVTFQRRAQGLDLLPLLVGSEGTLGILTRLSLRLHPRPQARAFAAFELPDLDAALAVLRRIYQGGLRPAVARLYDPLDSILLRATHSEPKAPLSTGPLDPDKHVGITRLLGSPRLLSGALSLLERTVMRACKIVLMFEGAPGEVDDDAASAAAIAREERGTALGEPLARAWFERRYAVSYEQSRVFRHASFSDTMEVAAPWSRLPALYDAVRRALGRHVLVMAHFSHAYPDGSSIYFTFVGASRSGRAVDEHRALWREALAAALDAGGTISHHHGVGELRAAALGQELGEGGIEAIAALKRAWDPAGILCPESPFGRSVAGGAPDAAPDSTFTVDEASGLVRAPGSMKMAEVERRLGALGRTLGLDTVPDLDVSAFVASGMPGAPDHLSDPVAQRLAGFAGTLRNGLRVALRPAPRRATGPDLGALFVGANGRAGKIEHAWLPAVSMSAPTARVLPLEVDREPAVGNGEQSAWERIVGEFEQS